MVLGIKEIIAQRAAQEIKDGSIVNLGIGMPTLVANFIPEDINIVLHSENGILGMGFSPPKNKEDPNLINAGGLPVTINPGASYFDSAESFGIIRGGYLDYTMLGALQVSEKGDLANWIIPGKFVPGMGGGMDLAQKARKTIILTQHLSKKGEPKLVKECSLPLTAKACADIIITDMGFFTVTSEGLYLSEIAESKTVEDVIRSTGAKVIVSDSLKIIKNL